MASVVCANTNPTSGSRRDELLNTLTIADFKEACRRQREQMMTPEEVLEAELVAFDKQLADEFWDNVHQ